MGPASTVASEGVTEQRFIPAHSGYVSKVNGHFPEDGPWVNVSACIVADPAAVPAVHVTNKQIAAINCE